MSWVDAIGVRIELGRIGGRFRAAPENMHEQCVLSMLGDFMCSSGQIESLPFAIDSSQVRCTTFPILVAETDVRLCTSVIDEKGAREAP